MPIPTKRVRRADGAEAIINAEDFDPAVHEDLDAAPAPKPKAKAAKPAPAPEPEEEGDEDTGV